MIVGGGVFHPLSAGVEMLKFFPEFIATAPDELTVCGPHDQSAGRTARGDGGGSTGPMDEGERRSSRSRNSARRSRICWDGSRTSFSRRCSTRRWRPGGAWKADFLKDFSDTSIETAVVHSRVPAPMSMVLFVPISGAAGRVPVEATAFPHRNGVQLGIYGQWQHDAESEPTRAWCGTSGVGFSRSRGARCTSTSSMRTKARIAFGLPTVRTTTGSRASRRAMRPGESVRLNANVQPARLGSY